MADGNTQPNYMAIGMAGLVVLVGAGVLLREAAQINRTVDRRASAQPVDPGAVNPEWMEKIRQQMDDIRS